MKHIKVEKLFSEGKALFLAYDHGIEHGPIDFNANNVDPEFLLYIATQGKYNAVILQKGIAEMYHDSYFKKVPLIVKLNGKTSINRGFPIAKQNCSIKKAVDLGADAVGYTLYVGSPLEPEIFQEFGKLQEDAHDYGLPVIAWCYPEGRYVVNELSTSMLSYASRVGLELGADIIKLNYNDRPDEFRWVIKCAGKTKVMIAGGPKVSDRTFLLRVKQAMDAGASGFAVGKEIWQHEVPMKITNAVRKIVFENSSVDDALKLLE